MTRLPNDKWREAVEHLLVDVMGHEEDNDVMKALEHFMGVGQFDIYKLTEMTNDQIHDMKYKGNKGAFRSLPKGQTTCLVTFNTLYWECFKEKDPMWKEFLILSHDDFEDYEQYLILQRLEDLMIPTSLMEYHHHPQSKMTHCKTSTREYGGTPLPRDQGY